MCWTMQFILTETNISLYLKRYLQKKFFWWHNVILGPKTTTPFLEEGNILAQLGREATGNLYEISQISEVF